MGKIIIQKVFGFDGRGPKRFLFRLLGVGAMIAIIAYFQTPEISSTANAQVGTQACTRLGDGWTVSWGGGQLAESSPSSLGNCPRNYIKVEVATAGGGTYTRCVRRDGCGPGAGYCNAICYRNDAQTNWRMQFYCTYRRCEYYSSSGSFPFTAAW